MLLETHIQQVPGGFEVTVEHGGRKASEPTDCLKAVATTPRQAGLRAGELARKLIEAEFCEVRNK